MKISTKGRYGLRILLDLVLHTGDSPRMIRDIAQTQQISEKYVGRLILDLRRAGLVESVRGAKGGYRIKKLPETLSLLDIVEVMEGPVRVVECLEHPKNCNRIYHCAVRDMWNGINDDIRAALSKMMFKTIVEKQTSKDENSGNDYCI